LRAQLDSFRDGHPYPTWRQGAAQDREGFESLDDRAALAGR
jgi:hypothetical protein